MWDAWDLEKERDPYGDLGREQNAHRTTREQYEAWLDEARADRDRLRDGIKALIDGWEGLLQGCPTSEWEDGYCDALREHTTALHALLDGEAKG